MQVRRAVILWAGFGRRISAEYGGIHKATILLSGRTLASRLLENIYRAGIREIIPILGYKSEDIVKEIKEFGKFDEVTPVLNERYRETNNLFSICQAKDLLSGKDFVVVNGDMVFDYRILYDICQLEGNAVATDINEYPYMIDSPRVKLGSLGNIEDIGRHMERIDANGYAVGIYKFSSDYSKRYFEDGVRIANANLNAGYHEPLEECFSDVEWKISPTNNYEWMDVDEKADIAKAEAMISRIENG